ncbi:MAG: MBL fold metallo-hydrolase [Bacteroidales bacterium]|nr:MBL fold metallo-hydrolase [Bacteroidales bacterium]
MRLFVVFIGLFFYGFSSSLVSGQEFQTDVIETIGGDLAITFIGHSSLVFEFQGQVIHIDPWGRLADYSKQPKADLIVLTHEHADHFDINAIEACKKEGTKVLLTKACYKKLKYGQIMKNGDYYSFKGIPIEAVAAYNILSRRGNGQPYHPKGVGNGYIFSFGNKRVYVAGDTELIPEMDKFQKIDIAFLPMNIPYTMPPEMVAMVAEKLKPAILYPYHYGNTKTEKITRLLMGSGIDVRIRSMK